MRKRTAHETFLEAVNLLVRERQRQIHSEGFKPERDDAYTAGELADAAATYAAAAAIHAEYKPTDGVRLEDYGRLGLMWPWSPEWFKGGDQKRALVKAGGLILAELERVMRAEQAGALPIVQHNHHKESDNGPRG